VLSTSPTADEGTDGRSSRGRSGFGTARFYHHCVGCMHATCNHLWWLVCHDSKDVAWRVAWTLLANQTVLDAMRESRSTTLVPEG
jgi:hypothetical protein